jgi:membrane protease YdiL (CAAX protease family)
MMAIKALNKGHPVLVYYALTFVISWGGVLLVIGGLSGIPGTTQEFEALFPIALPAMLAAPSVAGLLLTGLVHGRAGFRDFLSRLIRWRVGVRWYAVALLTAPVLMMAVLLGLSLFSPQFLPAIFVSDDRASLLLFGISVGLAAGVIEELGWTGFAVPGLRQRYSVLATGLIVGFLWGAWHLLVGLWASGTVSGAFSVASYLLDPLMVLPVFRMVMVWVYDRTGSLLLGILMHASLTASARIVGPPGMAGVGLLAFDLAWAAVVCIVLAAVAMPHRGQPSRQLLAK